MNVLWLSREDVARAGGGDPVAAVPVVREAMLAHGAGDTAQPPKPYLRIPNDTHGRRIIAMPAYIGGEAPTWGIKWIASAPENPTKRGIERASAIIVLNDLETGYPLVVMEGALISATRTAAVALLATEHLKKSETRTMTLIGTGLIGGLVTRSLLRVMPSIERIRLFDHYPGAAERFSNSGDFDHEVAFEVFDGAQEAMAGAQLVAVATTATDGYIDGAWLERGSLFLNISLRDPKSNVIEVIDKLVVDDWEQANRGGTFIHRLTEAGELTHDGLYAEISEIASGEKPGRESDDGDDPCSIPWAWPSRTCPWPRPCTAERARRGSDRAPRCDRCGRRGRYGR